MPATNPRHGLPANIKFNPANGGRAELDAEGVMARLEAGVTRRKAFDGLGGVRLFSAYCEANAEWAARAEGLLKRNAGEARRKGASARPRVQRRRTTAPSGLRNPDAVMQRLEAGLTMTEAYRGIGSHRSFVLQCENYPAWGKRASALLRSRKRKPIKRGPRKPVPAGIKVRENGQRAELDADATMARLEAGATRRRAFDGVGGLRLYAIYCTANPGWAARAEALLARNAEAARRNKESAKKRKDPTRCKRGHDLTIPENFRRNSRTGTLECKVCARENAKFTGRLMTPALRAKVMEAMARKVGAETIKKICHLDIFYRQRRRDPEFAVAAEEWLVGFRDRQAKKASLTCKSRRYKQIDAMVPTRLKGDDRAEIIGMIYEAIAKRQYRGKCFFFTHLADNMKNFISDFYKENPTKAYGKIDSPWSLDAPVSCDSDTKLIDTISRGLWQ